MFFKLMYYNLLSSCFLSSNILLLFSFSETLRLLSVLRVSLIVFILLCTFPAQFTYVIICSLICLLAHIQLRWYPRPYAILRGSIGAIWNWIVHHRLYIDGTFLGSRNRLVTLIGGSRLICPLQLKVLRSYFVL
jgi:hypothetical protein